MTFPTSTPGTGLSCCVVGAQSARTAPEWVEQGTALSFAGTSAFPVSVAFGARSTDLPGLPPRGAPV